jgi:hypothetical protein
MKVKLLIKLSYLEIWNSFNLQFYLIYFEHNSSESCFDKLLKNLLIINKFNLKIKMKWNII